MVIYSFEKAENSMTCESRLVKKTQRIRAIKTQTGTLDVDANRDS
jgi:hypothetical protein